MHRSPPSSSEPLRRCLCCFCKRRTKQPPPSPRAPTGSHSRTGSPATRNQWGRLSCLGVVRFAAPRCNFRTNSPL
eukprot:12914269-Prorocentrum_lima.AAC.1